MTSTAGAAAKASGLGMLLFFSTMASWDGNIIGLSATGDITDPWIYGVTGLTSIAGVGVWALAQQHYPYRLWRHNSKARRELLAVALISTAAVLLACFLGDFLRSAFALRWFPVFAGGAVSCVALAFLWDSFTDKKMPSRKVRGFEVQLTTFAAIAWVLTGTAVEVAAAHLHLGPVGVQALVAPDSMGLHPRILGGFYAALIAWGSALLFTRLDVKRYLNRHVYYLFGGLTLLLVASRVAGHDPGRFVIQDSAAPLLTIALLLIGVALSAFVRWRTGVSGWPPDPPELPPAVPDPTARQTKRAPARATAQSAMEDDDPRSR